MPSSTAAVTKDRTVRVCVLSPSYENSESATKEWDSIIATPQHFFPDGFVDTKTATDADSGITTTTNTTYTFAYIELKKATTYRDLRSIIKSNKYDVYFNLCDGAKDEDRAGEEVVRTLEEFNVPFTGSASKYFELSKPDMKMMAHYCNIPTARHAVLDAGDLVVPSPVDPITDEGKTTTTNTTVTPSRVEAKCSHLRFPVIVKHVSGYASIGMTKENKCENMSQLVERARIFIEEFDFALVEEFIVGDEATVLACADSTAKDGIRVYHPVMVNFPEGSDFKHFELKWAAFDGMEWLAVPDDDPSLAQIIDIGRRSFKEMMGGIGYGRCDLRINRQRNEVVFLEINPNCGIMYPHGQEGSADYILQMEGAKQQKEADKTITDDKIDKSKGQRDFAITQIENAIARCESTKPLWYRSFDSVRDFHLRAAKDIKKGTIIFNDEGRAVRMFTKPFVDATWSEEEKEVFNANAWPIGGGNHYFAVWDVNPANWRTFNHSEDGAANLIFAPNRSLNIIAARDIKKGEELTMNYDSLKSESMPQPKRERKSSGECTPVPSFFPTTVGGAMTPTTATSASLNASM